MDALVVCGGGGGGGGRVEAKRFAVFMRDFGRVPEASETGGEKRSH